MELVFPILGFLSGFIVGAVCCSEFCHDSAVRFVVEKKKEWITEGYTLALLDSNLKPKKEKKNHENISTEIDGNIITIHRHGYRAGN